MQFLSEPSGTCSDVASARRRGARWRAVGVQRFEGVDDRCLVVRLGALPGPDQLGYTEAPRPHGLHAPIHQPTSKCTASRC